jgi:mono/diheme cytochrome c family protein
MMSKALRSDSLLLVLLVGALCAASPEPRRIARNDVGARLYQMHCAGCHGADARGEGPRAAELPIAPPDLTLLAKRNGGKYPRDGVERAIDGRGYLPGHGGTGMPAWGDRFLDEKESYSEAKVKERIGQLVDYIASLQRSERRK